MGARINPNGNTVKDVPAKDFIEAFAKHLKKGNKIAIPEWGQYVKTACFKELAPYDNDWLYTRAASIAYQVYMRKKVGVNGMRKHYGTGARRGVCKPHQRSVAGKNIRYCINQLATAGIIASVNLQGDDGSSIPVGKHSPRREPPIWAVSPLPSSRRPRSKERRRTSSRN